MALYNKEKGICSTSYRIFGILTLWQLQATVSKENIITG